MRKTIEQINNLRDGAKGIIAAPYSWSPDECPGQKFGGDGLLLEIPKELPALLRKLGGMVPDNASSLSINAPQALGFHSVKLDQLSEPAALGHGEETLDLAKRLGQADKCDDLLRRLCYEETDDGMVINVNREEAVFCRSMYPAGTLYGRYDAELCLGFDALDRLMEQALSHCMSEEEMQGDSRDRIFDADSCDAGMRPGA